MKRSLAIERLRTISRRKNSRFSVVTIRTKLTIPKRRVCRLYAKRRATCFGILSITRFQAGEEAHPSRQLAAPQVVSVLIWAIETGSIYPLRP